MVAATSAEIDDFTEKFEKEFSLIACVFDNSIVVYEDSELWLVNSGASNHMTGMRSVFHSVSETNSYNHVSCGDSTMHAI